MSESSSNTARHNPHSDVVRVADLDPAGLTQLLNRYQLDIEYVTDQQTIPGSFWGDEEAGLIENRLYVRADTPAHSLLHEACHYICMDPQRREHLHTNAGGDYDEENAVCYLQILLADHLPPLNKSRMMADMDLWGYSFRLGCAQRWFEEDAQETRHWLQTKGLIDAAETPTWVLRTTL